MDSTKISSIIRSKVSEVWETQKYHCVELSNSLASSRSILIIDRSATYASILDQIITVCLVPVENLDSQSGYGLWRCKRV
jgi:hypothetical protein